LGAAEILFDAQQGGHLAEPLAGERAASSIAFHLSQGAERHGLV